MGIYGYCVAPRNHEPPAELHGINGEAVAARPVGELVVWVSELERPEPTVDHAVAHNKVVEAAVAAEVTPVPLRFGQWSDNYGAFDAAIRDRSAWYSERLRTFAGSLEFGLRVLNPEAGPARLVHNATAVTGLEYMRSLRDRAVAAQVERDEADRICASIEGILGALVREQRVEHARTTRGLIDVAHLVARPDFDTYRTRAASLRQKFPELRFLVSGPWVPYSFAA